MTKDEALKEIADKLCLDEDEARKIVEKCEIGGDIVDGNYVSWLENRFFPNCVDIDENGYAQMCVEALKILGTTVASDYGTTRQRDMGQLWADMTRGYLGEYAVKLFLEQNWKIDAKLGHDVGSIEEYLPSDIYEIRLTPDLEYRTPKINIGIKSAKWNAIWLDIPGIQYNHSDIHILVKVGAGRDHLFAFFKKISVFRDKILKKGEEVGSLSSQESLALYDQLPTFKKIPALICGFVEKSISHDQLSYGGKCGRRNYTINRWNGRIKSGDLVTIKEKENVSGSIKFEGIGEFSHSDGYLFNTGNLLWSKKDFETRIIRKF